MREIRIPAYAKVNLRLDVLGKRPDGYHELRTVFQTVSLGDSLRFRPRRAPGIGLQIQGNDQLSREAVERNLVYRAVHALHQELKITTGIEILLQKAIPAGRGLGGGSSDAAAALLGYLQCTRKKIPHSRLLEIAVTLGADVPFFLLGGRALGIGKGDEIYPLPDLPKLNLLIVSPASIHVPTPDAYRWLNAPELTSLTKCTAAHKLLEFCALCWSSAGSSLSNDFEPAVFQRYPRLDQIRQELLQRGASEALLAGSGSAVFGVFPSPAKARRAVVGFPHDQTFVCETISRSRYARLLKIASVV
jgi:4-diphosphocytidyl-2-C-methyl-D-erythritol kinase